MDRFSWNRGFIVEDVDGKEELVADFLTGYPALIKVPKEPPGKFARIIKLLNIGYEIRKEKS